MQLRDLKRQYEALKPEMDVALLSAVASGNYILGTVVEELEQRLAGYVGVQHCISCASGTDALALALMVWDVGEGDAVFVPDFTFFATVEVVLQRGAMPVLVDVNPATYNMDVQHLKQQIERVQEEGCLRPRAIIAVDLFGLPADMVAIRQQARQHGMYLLEDAAQGFGGSLQGQRAGALGDISTTSFFPAKPLGCYGDGGALFTDNKEWADALRSLRLHGKGSDKYHNVRVGTNSRLDALQAAVLQVKMDAFENGELRHVNEIAQQYTDALQGLVQCPQVPTGYSSSWAQYTIRLRNKEQRDTLQQYLQQCGVPSVVYYPVPMHEQPAVQAALSEISSCQSKSLCPVSAELCGTVLSLPMHPYLTDEEVRQVIQAVLAGLSASNK